MKRCPNCSSMMPDDAVRCIKCGADARPAPGPGPAARPAIVAVQEIARMGRIRRGWELTKQSWRVLMLDKELLIFPLLSGLACFLVLAGFFAGALVTGIAHRGKTADETAGWVLLFAYYFANYFVIVFFNSALVACAMIRFRGGVPTVGDGLRAAGARIAQIAAWVLLAATVGVVLRAIQERVEAVGKIVVALLGAGWTIATYFIVPVLVVEKLGPVDALGRSATLVKQTWGESAVSNMGIGLISFLATLAFIVVAGVASVALFMSTGSFAALLVGGAACAVFVIVASLASSALSTIVLSALYLYAAEKTVPQAFEAIAQGAFAPGR